MTAIRTALVAGGGIGGLTAAAALAQQGIAVDLVEIQDVMTIYGVGIIQPNNTLRALAKIGVAQACVGAGAPYPGWRIYDAHGAVLMDAPSGSEAAPEYPPNNGITRPILHQILTTAAKSAGAHISYGESIADLTDDGEGVDVRFTSGATARYDLVIGCDGLYSTMRRRLFGNGSEPEFTGQGVWRYNLPRPASMEWGELYEGPDSKVGFVPLSPSLMYMLIVTAEPGNPRFERSTLADEMRMRLRSYTGIVAELAHLITDPDEVVYRPLEALLLPDPWMKGRVIVIGDAAHGTTPHLAQGAAMAIEDAVLLGELMGRDAPVNGLLREFMDRRFTRSKFVVDSSRQIGIWEMQGWQGISNPDAHPGALLHSATLALMQPF